jgi:hypothetical protein
VTSAVNFLFPVRVLEFSSIAVKPSCGISRIIGSALYQKYYVLTSQDNVMESVKGPLGRTNLGYRLKVKIKKV